MAKLVVLITAQLDAAHRVGEAWTETGAPGVTFVESYGLHRLKGTSEILSGMLSMVEILRANDTSSVVVLSLVDDHGIVDALIRVTESILGDMEAPDNGIVFVLDVERALGIRNHGRKS